MLYSIILSCHLEAAYFLKLMWVCLQWPDYISVYICIYDPGDMFLCTWQMQHKYSLSFFPLFWPPTFPETNIWVFICKVAYFVHSLVMGRQCSAGFRSVSPQNTSLSLEMRLNQSKKLKAENVTYKGKLKKFKRPNWSIILLMSEKNCSLCSRTKTSSKKSIRKAVFEYW